MQPPLRGRDKDQAKFRMFPSFCFAKNAQTCILHGNRTKDALSLSGVVYVCLCFVWLCFISFYRIILDTAVAFGHLNLDYVTDIISCLTFFNGRPAIVPAMQRFLLQLPQDQQKRCSCPVRQSPIIIEE